MEKYLAVGALICAAVGAISDVRTERIPNWLTYGGLVLGLAARTALEGWRGLAQGAGGVLACGGIFFLFFLAHAMGAGDVKLMAAVGAWVGIKEAVDVVLATAIAGGILAVIYMVFYGRVRGTILNMGRVLWYHVRRGVKPHPQVNLEDSGSIRVPYGVAIAAGTLYLLVTTAASWRG